MLAIIFKHGWSIFLDITKYSTYFWYEIDFLAK